MTYKTRKEFQAVLRTSKRLAMATLRRVIPIECRSQKIYFINIKWRKEEKSQIKKIL